MASHDELRDLVQQRHNSIADGARQEAVNYQHGRGKLTARERIEALCDAKSFVEFGGLALPEESDPAKPTFADGLVTGWAAIDQQPVIVASSDFTVSGGSNGDVGFEKLKIGYERALNSGTPMVQLLEGVGHRISEGLDSRLFAPGFDVLDLQAEMSGWVPTPTAVLGQGFAAITLIASMCDFVVLVKKISAMGIAPPMLVKAGIGEDVDAEQLGGAEIQANQNGAADYLAESEAEALEVIKKYLSYFPANSSQPPPVIDVVAADPVFADKLPEVIPTDLRHAYDVRDAIKGIIDQDSLMEIKQGYARNIVCALARIGGRSVGIVANQPSWLAGSLDASACEKASHFINLCDAFGIPLIFMLDLPGFMPGTDSEKAKLARRSAKLIYEIARTTVPTYNIVLRKAFGGAYMAMNGGRTFGAEMTLAWPTAEFAAMNVETAVSVAYKRQLAKADDPEAERHRIEQDIRGRLGPVRAAEGFGIDDVILPEQTRGLLLQSLKTVPTRKHLKTTTPKLRGVAPI